MVEERHKQERRSLVEERRSSAEERHKQQQRRNSAEEQRNSVEEQHRQELRNLVEEQHKQELRNFVEERKTLWNEGEHKLGHMNLFTMKTLKNNSNVTSIRQLTSSPEFSLSNTQIRLGSGSIGHQQQHL